MKDMELRQCQDDGVSRNTVRRYQPQYSPKGASRPGVADNGGEFGGYQEAFLRLQRELFGYAPVYGGLHLRRTAEPVHAPEVLHAFSPGVPVGLYPREKAPG